jgi:MFS family permease
VSSRGARLQLALASAAVLLTAADTYVVVLALPAMIADVGISIDQLQRATPIVTGFLLGYVAVMPLLGRLSDIYGRKPVLIGCLATFAAGSLLTASATDLAVVVAGRALQGLGGGGLVPVTLALVADMWPPERRGFPLGVVGALQELGSVLGPLSGAAILTVSTWRSIFWINLALGVGLAGGLLRMRAPAARAGARTAREAPFDWIGAGLAGVATAAGALVVAAPGALVDDDVWGALYTPLGSIAWLTPLSLAAITCALAFLLWESAASTRTPLLARPASVVVLAQRADWLGSLLMAAALATVVVSFSTSDPNREAISGNAAWLLPLGAAVAALFVVRERAVQHPLIELRAFASRTAGGALLTNLGTGAALMATLVDVPILARATVSPDSQLGAAAVLLRLLAAVPVGALAGGWLCRRLGNRTTAATGLAAVTAMLALMTRWSTTTLGDSFGTGWLHPSDPVLVVAGLGFGLVIAPVNAAMLSAVRATLHGVASALVVVARMIGMLVGLSALTAIGLRAFFATQRGLTAPQTLCPSSPLNCPAYNRLVTAAIVDELRVVFLGAAVCAGVAMLVASLTLSGRPERAPLLVS